MLWKSSCNLSILTSPSTNLKNKFLFRQITYSTVVVITFNKYFYSLESVLKSIFESIIYSTQTLIISFNDGTAKLLRNLPITNIVTRPSRHSNHMR